MMKINDLDIAKNINTKFKPLKSNEMRILIVDDDREDFLYLSEVLKDSFDQKAELSLDSAVNFEEAMSAITTNNYDLVILDFQLGYLNGLDIQEAIKKEQGDLPVLFITGQGDERVAVTALKQGALDYLVKDNLEVKTIQAILEKVFNKHGKSLIENTKRLFVKPGSHSLTFQNFLFSLDSVVKLKVKIKGKFLAETMPMIKETLPLLKLFDYIRLITKI